MHYTYIDFIVDLVMYGNLYSIKRSYHDIYKLAMKASMAFNNFYQPRTKHFYYYYIYLLLKIFVKIT